MTDTAMKTPLQTGLFSADSHVMEPVSAWKDVLPPNFWPDEGKKGGQWDDKGGGRDPERRSSEMAQDGVIGEVLYPSRGLSLFGIEDVETHTNSCRAYNNWLIEYCSVAPDRLLGIGMVPSYNVDRALEEIRYCHAAGMKGIMLWEIPHPDLPFRSEHYNPIWAELEKLNMSLSFHILTGFKLGLNVSGSKFGTVNKPTVATDSKFFQTDRLQRAVDMKACAAQDLIVEFVMTGILDRHPKLNVIIVEAEIGWLPFAAGQWDFYHTKPQADANGDQIPIAPISMKPSDFVRRQVYATFFMDPTCRSTLESFGSDNFMWSNDFPHQNSTWPNSREWISKELGAMPDEVLHKVLRTNAERLYGPIPDLGQ